VDRRNVQEEDRLRRRSMDVLEVDLHLEGRVDRPSLESPGGEAMEDGRHAAERDVELADSDRRGRRSSSN